MVYGVGCCGGVGFMGRLWMSRYLIMGGAGFIGFNIVYELGTRGEDVVVLDNLSSGYVDNLKGFGVVLVEGDICNRVDV